MSVQPYSVPDRAAARVEVFRLAYAIQTGDADALEGVAALTARARQEGWPEVERVGLFARAVHSWYHRDPETAAALEALLDRAVADGDHVLSALALAMRGDRANIGASPALVAAGEADLARAVVMLEKPGGGALERITAHTACGIGLYGRSLFELAEDQWAAALAAAESIAPGTVDFLVSPVLFNRAEMQVSWACMLYQLDDAQGLAERRRIGSAAIAAAAVLEMPDVWRDELRALDLLLAAISGDDVGATARARLTPVTASAAGRRWLGYLHLAAAVADGRANRSGASVAARLATAALDPASQPQAYDLALFCAAERETRGGAGAGLRYGQRQLAEYWSNRLAHLEAVRARIGAERLSSAYALVSRHASTDDLTGIGNRRSLDGYLDDLVRRGATGMALIVLDVDDFKRVNDRYGHPAGDEVLVCVARVLARSIRATDLAVRIGGDEFALVLADADVDTAYARAGALLRELGRLRFEAIDPGLRLGLSAGVAAGPPGAFDAVRAQADAALYTAKGGGGGLVEGSRVARPIRD